MSDPADTNGPDQAPMLRINPERAKTLAENLAAVAKRIDASKGTSQNVRLIAVSKLKPATDILAVHQQPSAHVHFGENYAQELTEKSKLLPQTIKWHMIGALQTNKCKPLAAEVPNLYCVSSVDTAKKANELEKGRKALIEKEGDQAAVWGKLRVLVQVNTSGEAEKSGVEPGEAAALCKHVREQCGHLQLAGVMTIGAIARSQQTWKEGEENEDFVKLKEVRDQVVKELALGEAELELSMGMSQDFESAVRLGSQEVRVGTTIFGERPMKKDAVVVEKEAEGKN